MKFEDIAGRSALFISIACAALLAATVVAATHPSLRAAIGLGPSNAPSYVAGQRVDLPAGVYNATPFTLVLFAQTSCAVCQKSKPLFHDVAAAAAARGLPFHAVMDTARPSDRMASSGYVESIGHLDLLDLDLPATKVKRVPTLILVDRRGIVARAWDAPLPSADILDVVLALPR